MSSPSMVDPPKIQDGQLLDSIWVQARLEDAWVTLCRLPSTGCYPAGFRNAWPDFETEVEYAADRLTPATPDAVSRMDEAHTWLFLIPPLQSRERRAIILRSMISRQGKEPAWRWIGEQLHCDKNTALASWHRGMDRIVGGLRRLRLTSPSLVKISPEKYSPNLGDSG